MEANRVCFTENSELKPQGSPRRQRAMNFLHSLSRRLSRRLQNDLIYGSEEDLRSSTDSYRTNENNFHSSSVDLSSDNGSDTGSSSTSDTERTVIKSSRLNRISILSIGRALNFNTSPTSRSLSCSNTPLKQTKTGSTKQPQRILRQPVNYVYLKGMSGLPTRRVPRSTVCCQYAYR